MVKLWPIPLILVLQGVIPLRVEAQTANPAVVNACYSNAYCLAVTVVVGGILYWSITQDGETRYYDTSGYQVYLEDPEGESERWSDYIWADNLAQAQRLCREYAQSVGAVYVEVRRVGRGSRYECRMRSPRERIET